MKKLISLLLALAMLMSISPLTFAAGEYGENIALNKPVTITGEPYSAGYSPDRLTDGKYSTTSAGGSGGNIYIGGVNKWSVVDLGGLYELSRVILYTRQDLDSSWARQGLGLAYGVEDDFSDMTEIGRKTGSDEFKSTLNVRLDDAPVARYVAMFCFGQAGNVAAELEVYGTKYEGRGSGDFTDLDTPLLTNAGKLVFNMGIMDGISKTLFGKNKLITRGEAAKIICNMAGLSEPSGYRDEFMDVEADHEYASYIQAGVDYGFISKDTHFRPDDYILGYELLKMILCVNGHYNTPAFGNVYPSKIIQIANDLELLDGANTDGWSNIGRGSAAVVIYNALRSNSFVYQNGMFIENDETLLETAFGYTLKTGIVTGNGATTLTDPRDTVNMNNIEIGGEEYTDASGLGSKFLGERVYFVLDEKEDSVITMWADEAKNKTVTLDAEFIDEESTKSNIVVYDENNKKTRYKIDSHAYTILNDVADSNITNADLIPENGYVTLLDNDNDGTYDIIKIYRPEILVVDSIVSDTYSGKLSVADYEGNSYEYDYEVVNVKNSNGGSALVDEISGKLVYIYASSNGALVNIQIMPEAIEDVVSGKSGETVKIGGVDYEKTAYFERVYDAYVEVGKTATFYVDLEGKLVVMSDVAAQSSSQVIGLVQKCIIDPGSEEYAIKVFDETGVSRDIKIGDIIVVNGQKMNLSELALIQNELVGAIGYMTITDDNVLKVLVTEDETLEPEGAYNAEGAWEPFTVTGYCAGTSIYDGHTLKCNVNTTAPVFTIPVDQDTGLPITDANFSELYTVRQMGAVFKSRTKNSLDYAVYGMDEYMTPTLLVREVPYSTASMSFEPVDNAFSEKKAVIVSSVRRNIDQYGDSSYTVTGYSIETGKETTFTTAAGLEYVINYSKLAERSDFPASYGGSYLYPERTVKKEGFIQIKDTDGNLVYEDYLTPFIDQTDADGNVTEGLQPGDIVRYYTDGGSVAKGVDLIVEKEAFTGTSKVIYNVGQDPPHMCVTMRLYRSFVTSVKEGYLSFDMPGAEVSAIPLDAFTQGIVVMENGKVESYPMSAASVVLEPNDKILIYTGDYTHISIIAMKD